jgi:enamine deaminase RidA (YjgF/YER057c/UK114 family)
MPIERTNPEGVFQPPDESSYTQVLTATGDKHVCVSGTVPKNAESKLVHAGDMEAQTRYVLQVIEQSLAAEGADMGDVIRRRIFTRDIDEFIENGAIDVLGEFWPDGEECTSTLVEVGGLADQHHDGPAEGVDHADPTDERFLVEIDVTAVIEE